jgi:hypothetical protein
VESGSLHTNSINSETENLKKGLHLMVVALKNMSLYPPTSKTNRQTIFQFHQWLNDYFSKNTDLTLIVAKDHLETEDGEIVYQEKATESIVATPLFRDGIQAVIFEKNLTDDEIKDFLLILNRFRNVSDDDHADLVTAMWEASFPNIKYQLADEYAEVDPEFDTAAMRAAKMRLNNEVEDTPWEALAPPEIEGLAPLAKNLGSLFALAADPSFLTTASSGRAGGGAGGSGSGGGRGDPGPENSRDSGLGGGDPGDGLGGGSEGQGGRADGGGPSDGSGPGRFGAAPADPAQEPQYGPGGEIKNEPGDYVEADLSALPEAFKAADLDNLKARGRGDQGPLLSPAETTEKEAERRLNFWGLTEAESQQVAALVKWDESRDTTFDALDIILVILKSPVMTPEIRPYLKNFIVGEVRRSIVSLELKNYNYFWDRLMNMSREPGYPQSAALIEELRQILDQTDILGALFATVYTAGKIDTAYDDVRYFLYQLPAGAVKTLAMGLAKITNPRLREMVLEVVAYNITQAEENFGPVIFTFNEGAIVHLIKYLTAPGRAFPNHLLTNITKHHNAGVRAVAAKALLDNDPASLSQLAHLAADPAVTGILRPYLAQKKESAVENYLLTFLQTSYQDSKNTDDRGTLECYRTLGQCATANSLPFLSEVLLKKSWKNLWGGLNTHKLGAALALTLMPQDSGAAEILKKASRSAFKNIRWAFQEAQKLRAQGRT